MRADAPAGGRRKAVIVALCAVLALAPSRLLAQDVFQDLFGGPRAAPRRAPPPPAPARAERQPKKKKQEAQKPKEQAKPAQAAQALGEAPPPPYEGQMMRLSEIVGALSFLRDLCGDNDGAQWRKQMTSLLDAEAPASSPRRQRLTASFNRGFRGYELTYRVCTPNARTVIARYLDESAKIARDISYRYGNP